MEGDETVAALTAGLDGTRDLTVSGFDKIFVEVGGIRQRPVGKVDIVTHGRLETGV